MNFPGRKGREAESTKILPAAKHRTLIGSVASSHEHLIALILLKEISLPYSCCNAGRDRQRTAMHDSLPRTPSFLRKHLTAWFFFGGLWDLDHNCTNKQLMCGIESDGYSAIVIRVANDDVPSA